MVVVMSDLLKRNQLARPVVFVTIAAVFLLIIVIAVVANRMRGGETSEREDPSAIAGDDDPECTPQDAQTAERARDQFVSELMREHPEVFVGVGTVPKAGGWVLLVTVDPSAAGGVSERPTCIAKTPIQYLETGPYNLG